MNKLQKLESIVQDQKNKKILCEKKTRDVVSYCCPYSRTEPVEGIVVNKEEDRED